jgi:hypothetical protein
MNPKCYKSVILPLVIRNDPFIALANIARMTLFLYFGFMTDILSADKINPRWILRGADLPNTSSGLA